MGLLFVTAIIVCTILVTAMSVWGIVQVETDVRDVVPESFDFIENTHDQLDSIYTNLTSAVANGDEIVPAVREAVQEVREDPSTELLATSDIETNETLFEILDALDEAADDAEDALDTVHTEINQVRPPFNSISSHLCRIWTMFWTGCGMPLGIGTRAKASTQLAG